MPSYGINRGINKSWEVAGLVASNVYYFAAAAVGTLVLFIVLYTSGVPVLAVLAICGVLGGGACTMVVRLNSKYGEFGLMKALAMHSTPKVITNRQSRLFLHLNQDVK